MTKRDNILKAVEILESADADGVPQIRHRLADGRGGFCALGLIADRAGFGMECNRYDALEDFLGEGLTYRVQRWNDTYEASFREISDRLRQELEEAPA